MDVYTLFETSWNIRWWWESEAVTVFCTCHEKRWNKCDIFHHFPQMGDILNGGGTSKSHETNACLLNRCSCEADVRELSLNTRRKHCRPVHNFVGSRARSFVSWADFLEIQTIDCGELERWWRETCPNLRCRPQGRRFRAWLGYSSFTSELIKSRKMKFNWCWSSETSLRSRLRVFVFFLAEGMDTLLPPAPEIQKNTKACNCCCPRQKWLFRSAVMKTSLFSAVTSRSNS